MAFGQTLKLNNSVNRIYTHKRVFKFPCLRYAIRGTQHRDSLQWVAALDLMRGLGAELLVPAHTQPLEGEQEIRDVLTAYRDAIQFVHDQTVRLMNKGLTGRQCAEVRQGTLASHWSTELTLDSDWMM